MICRRVTASRKVGDPIYDERGVKIGNMPPTKDELYTLPGSAALVDELPGQQPTRAADAQDAATMQLPARHEGSSVIPRAIDSEFEMQPSPIVEELLRSRRSSRIRLATTLGAGLLIVALISGIVAAGVIMMWYRDKVEPFADGIAALENYRPAYQTARIFDAEGNLLAAINSRETGARTAVPLAQISPFMIHAIVSQENERYFEDPGFDPVAIARAFFQNVSGGGIESGASTITQQIARNLVLNDRDVTVERKVNEILVALEIANRYDKEKILELYLNEIFFANQSYGVEAAANFYFGHSAAQLNYAQAALLASIVPSPVQQDPVANLGAAVAGMRSTMRKMIEVGCLQFQHERLAGARALLHQRRRRDECRRRWERSARAHQRSGQYRRRHGDLADCRNRNDCFRARRSARDSSALCRLCAGAGGSRAWR